MRVNQTAIVLEFSLTFFEVHSMLALRDSTRIRDVFCSLDVLFIERVLVAAFRPAIP